MTKQGFQHIQFMTLKHNVGVHHQFQMLTNSFTMLRKNYTKVSEQFNSLLSSQVTVGYWMCMEANMQISIYILILSTGYIKEHCVIEQYFGKTI